jgi:hypothetical protein
MSAKESGSRIIIIKRHVAEPYMIDELEINSMNRCA